jgi:hypothetical protein
MVIGTDCTDSCKSNYHTITTTAVPEMKWRQERDTINWLINKECKRFRRVIILLTWSPKTLVSFSDPHLAMAFNWCLLSVNYGLMVFNATFNNILAISWQSFLLVEETGVSTENHWPVASHWCILSHHVRFYRLLSFCPVFVCHCIVWPCSFYDFWLPFWYFQHVLAIFNWIL